MTPVTGKPSLTTQHTDAIFYVDNYGKDHPNVPKVTAEENCQEEERQLNESRHPSWTTQLPGKL